MFRSSAHGAPLRPPHAATSSRPAGHRLTLIACAGALHDPTFNSIPAAHDVWNLSLTPFLLRISHVDEALLTHAQSHSDLLAGR